MNKVDVYIGGEKIDLFEDESIDFTITTQDVKDISKVFGDYSNSFTVPASKQNNKVFSHYYDVDVVGGFNAATRPTAWIEVGNNVFREGVVELEEVQMRKGQPYAYALTFYSDVTSLKDMFGEDKLSDLNLSSYDHSYSDANILAGISGYVSGTSNSIVYPLISPVRNWIYDSNVATETATNIAYHAASGHNHGVYSYELKPAIKMYSLIQAIQTKYGITFNGGFLDGTMFGKLFMWCHNKAGYMFKGQVNSIAAEAVQFTSNTTGDYDLATQEYTITVAQEQNLRVDYSVNSTTDYAIEIYRNGTKAARKEHSGNVTNEIINLGTWDIGDKLQIRLAAPTDFDGSAVSFTSITAEVEYFFGGTWNTGDTVSRVTSQALTPTVVVADQMPDQKVSEFIGNIVRMFNLVIVPQGGSTFIVKPLDEWYDDGTLRDVNRYVDSEEYALQRIPLHREINFNYNETEAILGEQYRLANNVGYGDAEIEFSFEGDTLDIEVSFDNMLFERMNDLDTGLQVDFCVGKAITREIEPYLGNPFIFFVPDVLDISATPVAYIDQTSTINQVVSSHLVGNVDTDDLRNDAQSIQFNADIDPYFNSAVQGTLYKNYWENYITDLYSTSRRLFVVEMVLPLPVLLQLQANDTLQFWGRKYYINKAQVNLTEGTAKVELLNYV